MSKNSGFSLIELIITLVLVCILASIAIPTYQQYVLKVHRQTARADLLYIQLLQEHHHSTQQHFSTSLTELKAPSSSLHYVYSVPVATSSMYILQARVMEGSNQVNDQEDSTPCHTLTVDRKGARTPEICWG